MVYALLLLVIFILKDISKKKYFIIIGLILVVLSAFRSVDIGVDTYEYSMMYYNIGHSDILYLFRYMNIEKGYILFNYIINYIFGDNFQVLLFFVAVIYIYAVTKIVVKYSKKAWISYFLFIALGYYAFGMTGIRQTIALSITMMSVFFIKRNKFILFVLCIALASSFHASAVLFYPAYFMDKIKVANINMVFAVFLMVFIKIYDIFLFNFMNYYARQAYDTVSAGGDLMYLFLAISILLGVFYKERLNTGQDNFFFYMIVIAIMLWPVAKMHPALFRITYYYAIFIIIYLPNLFDAIYSERERVIIKYLYLIVVLYAAIYKFNIFGEYRFFR